jgi:hypothetical protein
MHFCGGIGSNRILSRHRRKEELAVVGLELFP